MQPPSNRGEAVMPNTRVFTSVLSGALFVAAGLAVGLWTKGFCGSAFVPARGFFADELGCAPLLESPRVLGVALLLLGLVLAAWPLMWRGNDKGSDRAAAMRAEDTVGG
jgi:hypothetical protein